MVRGVQFWGEETAVFGQEARPDTRFWAKGSPTKRSADGEATYKSARRKSLDVLRAY